MSPDFGACVAGLKPPGSARPDQAGIGLLCPRLTAGVPGQRQPLRASVSCAGVICPVMVPNSTIDRPGNVLSSTVSIPLLLGAVSG
jgi:hypothetical protein